MSDTFWLDLEKDLRHTLPDILKCILTKTGYNNRFSLEHITHEGILEIENHIEKHEKQWLRAYSGRDGEYLRKKPFKILPGHSKILFGLCETLKKTGNSNTNAKVLETHDETDGVETRQNFGKDSTYSLILRSIIEAAKKNAGKPVEAHRYSDVLKYFCSYIYMIGGKLCYETLSKNLHLPSASTIVKCIHKFSPSITEGKIRAQELSDYLTKFELPKTVWLSEDATGILPKVEYDSTSNQLVGLTLPTDRTTGIPIPNTFPARSFEEIQQHVTSSANQSTLAYIIVAQPIKENAPPFILSIFGTDNKFKTVDVLNRWETIQTELGRYGIDIAGISSDGDSRLLRSMKLKTKIGQESPENMPPFFNCSLTDRVFVQDSIHIGTKLRNRLLQPSILLPMGNKQVSISHLKILIENFPKIGHGLVVSDICPDDRQNFGSLEKIMSPRVAKQLQDYVTGSEATVMYLKLCHFVTSAFMEANLPPLERVYRVWFVIFFLRLWRVWIMELGKSSKYNIAENFITLNAYECIELNGHALVQILMKFGCANEAEKFIPLLFSSQPCESTFRQFRSMTSVYWTKINSSLLELFHIVGRIELQNYIIYHKASEVYFPRQENKIPKMDTHELPSNEEIFIRMEMARDEAIKVAKTFGIESSPGESLTCKLVVSELRKDELQVFNIPPQNTKDAISTDLLCNDIQHLRLMEVAPGTQNISPDMSNLGIRDYSDQQIHVSDSSPYTTVSDKKGNAKTVRKSSLVWALTTSKSDLSKDRLQRVQKKGATATTAKRTLRENSKTIDLTSADASQEAALVFREDILHIGDWCYFFCKNRKKRNSCEIPNDLLIGQILGFKYIAGRTPKEKQYSWNTAPINPNIATQLRRGIEVLATWYKYDENGSLLLPESEVKHFFINIEEYVGTTKAIERTTCGELRLKFPPKQLIYFNEQLVNLTRKRTQRNRDNSE